MPELIPAAPGSPEWLATRPPVKLTPWSRLGMIDGAYQAAMPARMRPGWRPDKTHSWMYRRGFARAFLLAREARHA